MILWSASTKLTGSGGEPDLAGGRRVVAGEFRGALLQPFLPDKTDQRLHLWPEIAALPHQQIKILPKQRDKIEAGGFCGGTGRNAAVGVAGAAPRRKIGPGETGRLQPATRLWCCACT